MELNLPSILTPDLGLLFWMLLAFLVVFFFLAKFGFPVIVGMVEKRKEFIDDSLRRAHEATTRLENIKQEGEAILQEARRQQADIIQQATATRDAIVEKAQDTAHEEAARIISEAKAEIEQQKQAAVGELRSLVATLSVEISEKILRQKLEGDKAQMELIDRMLDEVTAK